MVLANATKGVDEGNLLARSELSSRGPLRSFDRAFLALIVGIFRLALVKDVCAFRHDSTVYNRCRCAGVVVVVRRWSWCCGCLENTRGGPL
jgi:hypothetical protein